MSADADPSSAPGRITRLLHQVSEGVPGAVDRLMDVVLTDLRRTALSRLSKHQGLEDARPTELVHETYLRLFAREDPPKWVDRKHFFTSAAKAMQHIVIDRARRLAVRRSERARSTLVQRARANDPEHQLHELIALSEKLDQIEEAAPRRCQVVRLRFFVGLTTPQIAELLGVSESTVAREWAAARVWLQSQLADDD